MEQEKGLNEVNWDEHWYGEHMTRLARSNFAPCADLEGVLKIIAEATRRGEVKAWEEAANLIDSHSNFTDGGVDVHYSPLSEAIDAKLAELKKV